MKYTILGFSQTKAYSLGLTCKELVFLRWFVDFMTTLRMKHVVVEDKLYFWVDNKTVIEELPILRIKKANNLRRFLKNMIVKGVMEYYLVNGNMPFYRVNHEKAYRLVSSPGSKRGLSQKIGGSIHKDNPHNTSFYKDSSTINNLIKNLAHKKSKTR